MKRLPWLQRLSSEQPLPLAVHPPEEKAPGCWQDRQGSSGACPSAEDGRRVRGRGFGGLPPATHSCPVPFHSSSCTSSSRNQPNAQSRDGGWRRVVQRVPDVGCGGARGAPGNLGWNPQFFPKLDFLRTASCFVPCSFK